MSVPGRYFFFFENWFIWNTLRVMKLVLFSFKFLFVGRCFQDTLTLCGRCFSVRKQDLFLGVSSGFSMSSLLPASPLSRMMSPTKLPRGSHNCPLTCYPFYPACGITRSGQRWASYSPLLRIGQTHWLRSPKPISQWRLGLHFFIVLTCASSALC